MICESGLGHKNLTKIEFEGNNAQERKNKIHFVNSKIFERFFILLCYLEVSLARKFLAKNFASLPCGSEFILLF
ncbi:hypothetical protein CH376_14810 [Leptospira adleri]|uniref:Uncharacterized protein n=1 Tax=Leptospira adleri TaxID=2023186 RepID=A0ABX4NWQ6_9LEPT|nr:hypothetical protein CH376_14810 [Leptospira adleri]